MNRKLKWGLLLLLAVILVGLSIMIGLRDKTPRLEINGPFAANVRFPYVTPESNFYFFSGSVFAQYRSVNQSTNALTPYYRLPNVTQVLWNKNGALFAANGYTAEDQLYAVLQQANLPINTAYWWAVDFRSGSIKLVGSAGYIGSPVWVSNSNNWLYLGAIEEGVFAVFKQSFSTSPKAVAKIENPRRLLWADDAKLIYQSQTPTSQQIFSFNFADSRSSVRADASSIEQAQVSQDGSSIMYIRDTGSSEGEIPSGALVYSSGNQEPQTISDSFSGMIKQAGESDWAAYGSATAKDSLIYWLSSDRLLEYSLKGPKSTREALFKLGGILGNQLLLIDEDNQAYLASPDKLGLPTATNSEILRVGYESDGYSIDYQPTNNKFTLFIMRGPYRANLRAAINYIERLGIDPNQLNLKIVPGKYVKVP